MREPLRDKYGNLLRIRSNEERARIANRKGGFDFSWLDKKAEKSILRTRGFHCEFCGKNFSYIVKNHRKGFIILSCDTDGCPGNYAESVKTWDRKYRKTVGEQLDGKLMHDFKDLVFKRDPSRLFSARTRTIH